MGDAMNAEVPSGASAALQSLDDSLREARKRLEDAQIEVAALESARDAMVASLGGRKVSSSGGRRQTVAAHHVEAVKEYLEAQGRARQSDIGKELGINSGIVSVALKALADRELIEPREKDYGSRVWEWVDGGANEGAQLVT
jgi:hypothetical protein